MRDENYESAPSDVHGDGAARRSRLLRHQVGWVVKPSLQVNPAVLIVKPEPTIVDASVEIRSDDRSFRVLHGSGTVVKDEVAASAQESTRQSVRIPIDLSRIVPGEKPEIEILTDHPAQPKLRVSLLVLPTEKGRAE